MLKEAAEAAKREQEEAKKKQMATSVKEVLALFAAKAKTGEMNGLSRFRDVKEGLLKEPAIEAFVNLGGSVRTIFDDFVQGLYDTFKHDSKVCAVYLCLSFCLSLTLLSLRL